MKASLLLAKRPYFPKACFALAGLLLFSFSMSHPTHAEDTNPFEMNSGGWISFDHYKESTRLGRTPLPEPASNTEAATPASDEKAAAAAITVPAVAPQPATIAAPTRAVILPVMPGINKGYDIQVKSTTDDEPQVNTQITNTDETPDIHLKEQNWQKASTVAHKAANPTEGDDAEENRPLDIRMSYLPNTKVVPTASVIKPSNHGRPAPGQPIAVADEESKKKTPSEAAACAAIDAYKKQQLQAIQSDRQTLKDLQAAIAQLGLQKQLNFLTDAQGSVSASNNASEKMNMPAGATAQP